MSARGKARLFLDNRWIADRDNLERVPAPCTKHPGNPLRIDGEVLWTHNNLAVTVYRDEAAGEFRGWRGANERFLDDQGEERWRTGALPVRSSDGIAWETTGEPWPYITVMRDERDPDPGRRYKALYQGEAVLDESGQVAIPELDEQAFAEAKAQGRKVSGGMFVACSPDGVTWHGHVPVVINTRYEIAEKSGVSGDRWWKPGAPGWSGGDSFPCLLWNAQDERYVAFFRTNIDRRDSMHTGQMRRERGVGRAESADFRTWSPHELVLQSHVTWQRTMGYGPHDFYQFQVWPCADVWLGIVSAFYWTPDTIHNELVWSPDTFHWERICPGTDLIAQGRQEDGDMDWGCCFGAMRPVEVGDDVYVYYGGAAGRHNRDVGRESALHLAVFRRDRFAGLRDKGGVGGALLTEPVEIAGPSLVLNADASQGAVKVGLCAEDGIPLPGYGVSDALPIKADGLDSVVQWSGGKDLRGLAGQHVRLRVVLENAAVYAVRFEAD